MLFGFKAKSDTFPRLYDGDLQKSVPVKLANILLYITIGD